LSNKDFPRSGKFGNFAILLSPENRRRELIFVGQINKLFLFPQNLQIVFINLIGRAKRQKPSAFRP